MLILLENQSRILHEAVFTCFRDIVQGDPNVEEKTPILPMDLKFCDFDGTRFRVSIRPEDLDHMRISLQIPCFKDLIPLGVHERLEQVYGNLVSETADEGFDCTLEIDLRQLPDDYSELADRLSLLKHNVFGAPYHKYFKALQNEETLPAGKVHVSHHTSVYFVCGKERVVVIFSLNFAEKFDEVIARVFLQALSDKNASSGHAPVVSFDLNPPNELRKEFGIEDPVGNVGFVSMVLMPMHVQTDAKIENAAGLMQNFRNYVLYHIKCSKTFFHSQMRARVKTMLQVLNRAKNDVDESSKKKKTASGRTFERK